MPTAGEMLRDWFQHVWNEGHTDPIDALLAPDIQIQGLEDSTRTISGPEHFREFHARMRATFSDMRFTVHDLLEAGPLAAARWSAVLRHTGEGMGVPATGKEIAVTGMTFIRIDDGRIVAGWNEWDSATLIRAIGGATG